MKTKEVTKGKWKVTVTVEKLLGNLHNLYKHNLVVTYNDLAVNNFKLISSKKKLDPYMWFECYEAFTYHKPSMGVKEWEDIIRELDKMK